MFAIEIYLHDEKHDFRIVMIVCLLMLLCVCVLQPWCMLYCYCAILWVFDLPYKIAKFRSLTRARPTILFFLQIWREVSARAAIIKPRSLSTTSNMRLHSYEFHQIELYVCFLSLGFLMFFFFFSSFVCLALNFFLSMVLFSVSPLDDSKVLIWLNLQYVSKSLPFALIAPRFKYCTYIYVVRMKAHRVSTSKSTTNNTLATIQVIAKWQTYSALDYNTLKKTTK